MKTKTFLKKMFLLSFSMMTFVAMSQNTANQVEIYTSNTKVSLSPGESVNYTVEVNNKGTATALCDVSITGIPKTWNYSFKSGSYTVKQIAIKPKESNSLKLKLNVPIKVNK